MEIKNIEAVEVENKRGGDTECQVWAEVATGLPFTECEWTPNGLIYLTPCCHAAASIFCDSGVTYCKACYQDVDPRCGAWPGYDGSTYSYRVIVN